MAKKQNAMKRARRYLAKCNRERWIARGESPNRLRELERAYRRYNKEVGSGKSGKVSSGEAGKVSAHDD